MHNEIQVIFVQIVAIWIIIVGFAMMVRGPRAAGAVFKWPFKATLRMVRSLIGGMFVSLGTNIKGSKK